jgi:hypothetical protein
MLPFELHNRTYSPYSDDSSSSTHKPSCYSFKSSNNDSNTTINPISLTDWNLQTDELIWGLTPQVASNKIPVTWYLIIGAVPLSFSVFSQLYKSGTQVKFSLSVSIGHNKFIIKDTVWNVCIYQQYLWQCYQQRWSSSDCLKWIWTTIQGHFLSCYNSGACKNFSSDICKCQKHTVSEAVYTFFIKYVKKIRLTQNNLRYNKTNPVTNAGFT